MLATSAIPSTTGGHHDPWDHWPGRHAERVGDEPPAHRPVAKPSGRATIRASATYAVAWTATAPLTWGRVKPRPFKVAKAPPVAADRHDHGVHERHGAQHHDHTGQQIGELADPAEVPHGHLLERSLHAAVVA
jgi:hypothetical protein